MASNRKMQENKPTLKFNFTSEYVWPVLILGVFCSDGPIQGDLLTMETTYFLDTNNQDWSPGQSGPPGPPWQPKNTWTIWSTWTTWKTWITWATWATQTTLTTLTTVTTVTTLTTLTTWTYMTNLTKWATTLTIKRFIKKIDTEFALLTLSCFKSFSFNHSYLCPAIIVNHIVGTTLRRRLCYLLCWLC